MEPSVQPGRGSILAHIWYTLLMRCPRCYKGALWRTPFRMYVQCASCGLAYEREPGYFIGAMYASYFIGVFVTMPVWIWMIIAAPPVAFVVIVLIGLILVISPFSYCYSRAIWIHIDYFVEPWAFVTNENVPGFQH